MKKIRPGLYMLLIMTLASCTVIKPDRTYELEKGEEFTIRLEANPSTGYQWVIAKGLKKAPVVLIKEDYQPAPNPSGKPLLGAGGTKIWHFRAENTGKTTLKLIYQRSGERAPGETKYFRISVH